MANYSEKKCPVCGHIEKAWWQPLSRSLVRCLCRFGNAVKQKKFNKIHLQREIELTKSEYNNFQKLQYFGLVAKHDERGCWVLTKRGLEFLQNKIAVNTKVLTLKDKKIEEGTEFKKISQFTNDEFGFASHYNFEIVDYEVHGIDNLTN